MKIFKIETGLTKSQFDIFNNSIHENDLLSLNKFFDSVVSEDVVEDGVVNCYLGCNDVALEAIMSIMCNYELKFNVKDVTEQFLFSQIKLTESGFQKFFNDNLDVDVVLDKINLHGIDSLTELEKRVLCK